MLIHESLQALLSGCSAGGLASILHCDRFRDLLPAGAKVKCLSDAGYFIDAYVILLSKLCCSFLDQFVYFVAFVMNFKVSLTLVNRKDISGSDSIKSFYTAVVNTHVCTIFYPLPFNMNALQSS